MVTVVVGNRTSDHKVCIVTTNKDADEPRRVDFSLSQLAPGKPAWASYVKGVMHQYRGKLYLMTSESVFRQLL